MKLKKIKSSGELEIFVASTGVKQKIPFVDAGVKAGFPSPAEDFTETAIDLNVELIKNPSSTFFARATGDSMQDFGVADGDLLVVDKSLEPRTGKIAVCYIDGEFTLKQIRIENECCWLVPGNANYQPIKATKDNEFLIWGIVTHSIKTL